MTACLETIAAYYPRIDDLDLDWVVALFAAGAVYQRADATYSGISEIEHFFRDQRKLRGRHLIDQLWEIPGEQAVVATGRFEGVGDLGDPRAVRFADVWHFDGEGRVRLRQTYLALGSDYVR